MSYRAIGPHRLSCGSLTAPPVRSLFGSAGKADVMYTDPPWGDPHMKLFATMRRKMTGQDEPAEQFVDLVASLMHLVKTRVRNAVFIEMGERWADLIEENLAPVVTSRVVRQTYYYSTDGTPRPFVLLAASRFELTPPVLPHSSLTGIHIVREAVRPYWHPGAIGFDPCVGQGMMAKAFLEHRYTFYGNEPNEARLQRTEDLIKRQMKKATT
jgi:hypothetical protein